MSTSQPTRGRRKTEVWLVGYQIFFLLAGLAYLLLRLIRRRPLPGLRQRLAWYPEPLHRSLRARHPIWIHLVSVGEVIGAQSLIRQLRERFPDQSWLITTTTATGQSVARQLIRGPQDHLLYLPWDLGPVIRRAIRAIRPRLFIAFEAELWPILFHQLTAAGVPVVVVNGRISPGAYRRYRWVRPFMELALERISFVLTQSAPDARRYAGIGAPEGRIAVTGNLKWDLADDGAEKEPAREPLRSLLNLSQRAVLWTAGSTHPGEEKMVLQVYRNLKTGFPELRLLIVPRHPERAEEVEQQIVQAGFRAVRRSRLLKKDNGSPDRETVFLLDTLGELAAFYQASDLVFVGGSLVPQGGHNLIEPAAFSRPILTGSHLHNFQAVAETLSAAGGLVIVKSAEELEEKIRFLLQDASSRRELGRKAYGVIREHRGATARTVALLLKQWKTEPPPDPATGHLRREPADWMAERILGTGALAYRAVLSGIGFLYRTKVLKVHRLPVPVVSVGNLTWGGTGKTPLVMQLAKGLREKGRVPAVLTRGYGRDEAALMADRLRPIPVLVGPDRVASGARAVREFGADLLLLDDGYQQWRLKKDLEILTVDATAPFGNGHLIPQGSLREPVDAAARADLIVVTKADLNPGGLKQVEEQVRRLNASAPIFFARYRPVGLTGWPSGKELPVRWLKGKRVCTLAGIARPETFEASVGKLGAQIALKYRVGDHHAYTAGELIRLLSRCQRHGIRQIVTTAKDAVRIPKILLEAVGPDLKGVKLLVLEVVLEFNPDEGELLHRIDTLLLR